MEIKMSPNIKSNKLLTQQIRQTIYKQTMRSKTQILKEIDKNLTYESIRFNNKQISDESIKNTLEQFFPKLFLHQKWKDISFFTKAVKDEEFYKKIRAIVNMHINIETHSEEIEQNTIEKSKIQDSSSHCLEEVNNKKMTRAALAKRNQMTQQELRKDQIYVRLTPKSQSCLQWMLCNRKFPRIQCKLSCNQHIEYLVNYLSNKWLPGKGHNRIVLYPDVGSFLKNTLPAKERQKILKEPLNNYLMFTDVMVGCGIGQNGILNLHYDILEKKKDSVRPLGMSESVSAPEKHQSDKKNVQGFENNRKVINLEQPENSNKKSSSMADKQEKYQGYFQSNHLIPKSSDQQKITFNPLTKLESLNNANNNNSNHFLSNQSNLLNPNRSIYNDDESIFKSIGFFAFANGNSIGFKKNDFNLLSINSNSLMDLENIHSKNPDFKITEGTKCNEKKASQQIKLKREQQKKSQESEEYSQEAVQEARRVNIRRKTQILQVSPGNKGTRKQQSNSPQKDQAKRQQKEYENSRSNKISVGQQLKEEEKIETKKHEQKLLDLRNAISFLEEAEGFKGSSEAPQEELSQKSGFKQIKTVSIKKKTAN